MKVRSRSLERKPLDKKSQPKVQEENLLTEDTRSQLSTDTFVNIESIQPSQQQQILNNFINQEHQAWPAFTVEPEATPGQLIEASLNKQQSFSPPKMSLNSSNTGFSITFETALPKLISTVRSPYKHVYQFYHNPEDNLTYFFKFRKYNTGIVRNYEIDCVPNFNGSKEKKMNKYYKWAYAMRTEDAKKTKEVIESIRAKFQEQEDQKKTRD